MHESLVSKRLKFSVGVCVSVYGCRNLDGTLQHAVVRRHGDTTSVRCLTTGETFFLTCIESRWVGELNNCSAPTRGLTMHRCFLSNDVSVLHVWR